MKSVYLAGPITGCSYGECVDWREYAIEQFSPVVKAFSPMRAKEFLKEYATLPATDYEYVTKKYDSPFINDYQIVTRDRNDVLTCDAVLMNLLDAPQISIGTMVELGWADAFRKPVILVWDHEKNKHYHGFVKALAPVQVTSLEDGIKAMKILLGAG